MTSKHTPAPWIVRFRPDGSSYISMGDPQNGPHKQADLFLCADGHESDRADARLIAAAPELLADLQRAQDFIDGIRQELHQRRVADWYPEGAHNAAEQMSEDMRLLGNACADFNVSPVLAKATGGESCAT